MRKILFALFLMCLCLLTSCFGGSEDSVKKYDLSNITFTDETVVYDGEEHSIYINGELPEGLSVEYINNSHVNAGKYRVKANIIELENNNLFREMEAFLEIAKKDITNELKFEDASYSHNGTEYTHVINTLPEGINVEYVNNKHTDVGTYEVIANLEDTTGNYIVPNEIKSLMSIVKDGKTHEVNFTIDDQIVSTEFINHGKFLYSFPELPDIAGYTGSWEYDLDNPILEDVVIRAKYTPNTYQITYDCGLNTIREDIVYGTEIELFDAELEGYIFNGWTYLGEDFTEENYLFTEDITLVADWTFDSSVQTFDYLNAVGDVDASWDGTQVSATGKSAIPFGNMQGEKWYVEVELKFYDKRLTDNYPKIGIMCGNNLGLYDDGQSTTMFYFLDFIFPNTNKEWDKLGIIGSANGYLNWSSSKSMTVDDKYHKSENIKIGILRDGNYYYLYYGVGNTYKCVNVIYDDSFDGESCYVWVGGYSCDYLASNPYVLRGDSVYTIFKTPTDVIVSNDTIAIYISESDQIEYQCDILDYDKSEILFASSDESVAVVDGNGLVTGVNSGECIITVSVGNVVREVSVLVILKEKGEIDGIMDDTIWSESVKATKVVLANNIVNIQVYAAKNEKGIFFFVDYKATKKSTDALWFISNNVQFKLFNGENKEIIQSSDGIWYVSISNTGSNTFTEAYIPELVYNNDSKLYEGTFEMFVSYEDLGVNYTDTVSFVVGSDLEGKNWYAENAWSSGNTSEYHVIA